MATTITRKKAQQKSAAPNRSKTALKAETSKPKSIDRIQLSRESTDQDAKGRSDDFLKGFQDNFELKNPKETAKSLYSDFRAGELSREELKSRIEELRETDPEAAKLLEEMLRGKKAQKEQKAEASAEHPAAAPGEHAGGHAPGGAHPAGGAHGPQQASQKLDNVPSGFLWKPNSESNGNLVILLPPSWRAKSVTVRGDQMIQSANKQGNTGPGGPNGGREHFRFSSPGHAFGSRATVEVKLVDGTSQTIDIPNTGARNEGKGK